MYTIYRTSDLLPAMLLIEGIRAIPFKKVHRGCLRSTFWTTPQRFFTSLGGTPRWYRKITQATPRQLGPCPTLIPTLSSFWGYPAVNSSNIYHYTPSEMEWKEKSDHLQYSGGPTLIAPSSDIRLFLGPPCSNFSNGMALSVNTKK